MFISSILCPILIRMHVKLCFLKIFGEKHFFPFLFLWLVLWNILANFRNNLQKIHTIIYNIIKCLHSYLGAEVARVYNNRWKVCSGSRGDLRCTKSSGLHILLITGYGVRRKWVQHWSCHLLALWSSQVPNGFWSHNSAIWKRGVIILTLIGVFEELNVICKAFGTLQVLHKCQVLAHWESKEMKKKESPFV